MTKPNFNMLPTTKLMAVLNEFRNYDPEMQIQTLMTFLFVSSRPENEPPTIKDCAEAVGIAQSSASRNVAALASINRHHESGHQLLHTFENPMRRTQKLVVLTPRGKKLLESVEKMMSN